MSKVADEEVRNTFKSLETVRKMLRKRGYILPETSLTLEKLQTNMDAGMKKTDLSFIAEKPRQTSESGMEIEKPEKIYVIFTEDSTQFT